MSQLTLFEPPAKPEIYDPGAAIWKRAFTDEVKTALLAVMASCRGEWLEWRDFDQVREKYDIGSCMGHVLFHLSEYGAVERKEIFLGRGIGAEQPGSPNYRGYTNSWRLPAEISA